MAVSAMSGTVIHATLSGAVFETQWGFGIGEGTTGIFDHHIELRERVHAEARSVNDPIKHLEELSVELDRQIRAEKLMRDVLGEEAYRRFLDEGYVKVASKKNPRIHYMLKEFGRVEVVIGEGVVEELCIVPTVDCPAQDALALKKLMIEGDEEQFLKIANHFPMRSLRTEQFFDGFRRRFLQ